VSVALTDDRLTCACIYDRHHISREAMLMAVRCKPAGKLLLVSDGTAALGAADGAFEADGVRYAVKAGQVTVKGTATLGGSAVSLLGGVRNVVDDLGLPLEDAWRLASSAPARVLAAEAKGEIAPGRDGDLVLLGDDWKVRATVVRGSVVHGSGD
jgi:N-acetylglucosamine-6-phosphate deacetylase